MMFKDPQFEGYDDDIFKSSEESTRRKMMQLQIKVQEKKKEQSESKIINDQIRLQKSQQIKMRNEQNQIIMDRLYNDPVANLIVPNSLTEFNMLYPNMNF